MGRLFCLMCQRISVEANHDPFSTAHSLRLVMLPFSAQTDKRRGQTQTFPNQCSWSSATTHLGYKTTLTFSGHVVCDEPRTHMPPQRRQTHAVQFKSAQTHHLLCTHTHTLTGCTCLSCWLVTTEAKLIQLQCLAL